MFCRQEGLSSGMRRTVAVLIAGLIAACAQTGSVQQPGRVSYVQNGDAKLRVFVEGVDPRSCCCQGKRGPRDFDELAKQLVSAGYRVVRPEPRGFGESVGPVEGLTLRDNARDVASAIEKVGAAPL